MLLSAMENLQYMPPASISKPELVSLTDNSCLFHVAYVRDACMFSLASMPLHYMHYVLSLNQIDLLNRLQ